MNIIRGLMYITGLLHRSDYFVKYQRYRRNNLQFRNHDRNYYHRIDCHISGHDM